jgi:type II secretory pathway predicted ATPase ExeA
MWKHHWGLARDPFLDPGSPYVPLRTHEQAVARLVQAIESCQPSVVIQAPEGLGKSRMLKRALMLTRSPSRRIAFVASPIDGAGLFGGLAEGLGARVAPAASRAAAWKALSDAARICRCQRLQVILAVDGCENLQDPADVIDVHRLTHLDPHHDARVTVVQATRVEDGRDVGTMPGGPALRLLRLTRSEAELYLVAKLADAGRETRAFTTRAVHRLHAYSGGSPRTLNSLASASLMAGATQGLDLVSPELVERISPGYACEFPLECDAAFGI